jgi:acyl-coenzyme A thioesterase PaaI-like protein
MQKDYQPNSHYCFVCGLKNEAGLGVRFENDGPGRVRVETQICDHHQGYPGIAHGGILATLLDETMGRAALSGGEDAKFFFTAKMEIRYRKSVPLNTDLVITAQILKDRGSSATSEGQILLPDGTVAVEGTATLFLIPAEEVSAMVGDADLGWRVYDDAEYENRVQKQ